MKWIFRALLLVCICMAVAISLNGILLGRCAAKTRTRLAAVADSVPPPETEDFMALSQIAEMPNGTREHYRQALVDAQSLADRASLYMVLGFVLSGLLAASSVLGLLQEKRKNPNQGMQRTR